MSNSTLDTLIRCSLHADIQTIREFLPTLGLIHVSPLPQIISMMSRETRSIWMTKGHVVKFHCKSEIRDTFVWGVSENLPSATHCIAAGCDESCLQRDKQTIEF